MIDMSRGTAWLNLAVLVGMLQKDVFRQICEKKMYRWKGKDFQGIGIGGEGGRVSLLLLF